MMMMMIGIIDNYDDNNYNRICDINNTDDNDDDLQSID